MKAGGCVVKKVKHLSFIIYLSVVMTSIWSLVTGASIMQCLSAILFFIFKIPDPSNCSIVNCIMEMVWNFMLFRIHWLFSERSKSCVNCCQMVVSFVTAYKTTDCCCQVSNERKKKPEHKNGLVGKKLNWRKDLKGNFFLVRQKKFKFSTYFQHWYILFVEISTRIWEFLASIHNLLATNYASVITFYGFCIGFWFEKYKSRIYF